MQPVDAFVADIAKRFGIGDAARDLPREVWSLIAATPGGLSGFLDRFRQAGLGATVATWLGRIDGQSVDAAQIEHVLGAETVSGIAGRAGISRDVAGTALGYVIPKIVGSVTPGGTVPLGVPAGFPAAQGDATSPDEGAQAGGRKDGVGGWGVSILAGLAGIGVIAWLMQPAGPPAVPPPAPTARVELPPPPLAPSLAPPLAPPLAPSLAPSLAPPLAPPLALPLAPPLAVTAPVPTLPPRLNLANNNGVVTVDGAVHDEAARSAILDYLRSVFDADKVRGDIAIDPARTSASWLSGLRGALEAMKIPGLKAVFDGDRLSLDGLPDAASRDRVMAALKAALGPGIGLSAVITDKIGELISGSSTRTLSALKSLAPGYAPRDLLNILNMTIINFATDSFEIPENAEPVLNQAAVRMKELAGGTKVEIAGYTDNTGDADGNLKLSTERAAAVRAFLVKAGVDPTMLSAKGYGDANPVASNDTPEGRFQNRRIEYHLAP